MADSDPIVEAVRADLLRWSQVGIAKYGVTLARADLSLRDWLQHAYEETLDQANYLKRAIISLDTDKVVLTTAIQGWIDDIRPAAPPPGGIRDIPTADLQRELDRREIAPG